MASAKNKGPVLVTIDDGSSEPLVLGAPEGLTAKAAARKAAQVLNEFRDTLSDSAGDEMSPEQCLMKGARRLLAAGFSRISVGAVCVDEHLDAVAAT